VGHGHVSTHNQRDACINMPALNLQVTNWYL
jgi:hypothetical protein